MPPALTPTPRLLRDLGQYTDTALGLREDVSASWVRLVRVRLGIAPHRVHTVHATLRALVTAHPGSTTAALAQQRGRSRQSTHGLLLALQAAGHVRALYEPNHAGGGLRARWYPGERTTQEDPCTSLT